MRTGGLASSTKVQDLPWSFRLAAGSDHAPRPAAAMKRHHTGGRLGGQLRTSVANQAP
jgi:hypothetical protein